MMVSRTSSSTFGRPAFFFGDRFAGVSPSILRTHRRNVEYDTIVMTSLILPPSFLPCLTSVFLSRLLTDMSTPLGLTAGNALEVSESVDVLAGGGPSDVVDLTLALATEMLGAAGIDDVDPAERLRDGSAMDVWRRMIRAQGGDPDAPLATSHESDVVHAEDDGVLMEMDALAVGLAAWRLGAGRSRKEDPVSEGAGVVMHVKPGATVRVGEPLLTLRADDPSLFASAREVLAGALVMASEGTAPVARPLVIERVTR